MSRMTIDCRAVPSESGCSLTISGEEDEVLRAATAHAIDVHGHTDGDALVLVDPLRYLHRLIGEISLTRLRDPGLAATGPVEGGVPGKEAGRHPVQQLRVVLGEVTADQK